MGKSGRIALIAGGGIGSLTAALALIRSGWSVEVFEKSPRFEEVGAGLQLSPNATRVLFALGLKDPLLAAAFEPQALELRLGKSGQTVFSIAAGKIAAERWGAPYLHIHRADLLSVLEHAVRASEQATLHLDTEITAYETSGAKPTATASNGETFTGDLIIGADGIHSRVRAQMIGPDKPQYTGNMAWRAVVPVDRLDRPPPPTACVWAGRGRHAVTYLLRGGQLANFVGVVETANPPGESWTQEGTRAGALADFAGWDLTITELINKAEAHFRWALHDRAPLNTWQDGAVTLLGDAAHPMLPFQAQGAAMAIEDAWVLADCLTGDVTAADAIARYQSIRLPRTSRMQAASRSNMGVFHRQSPAARLGTYGPMWAAGKLMPGFVRSRLDWIYGHDVTATGR